MTASYRGSVWSARTLNGSKRLHAAVRLPSRPDVQAWGAPENYGKGRLRSARRQDSGRELGLHKARNVQARAGPALRQFRSWRSRIWAGQSAQDMWLRCDHKHQSCYTFRPVGPGISTIGNAPWNSRYVRQSPLLPRPQPLLRAVNASSSPSTGRPFVELVPAHTASGMDFEKAVIVRRELGLDSLKVSLPPNFDGPAFSRQVLGFES